MRKGLLLALLLAAPAAYAGMVARPSARPARASWNRPLQALLRNPAGSLGSLAPLSALPSRDLASSPQLEPVIAALEQSGYRPAEFAAAQAAGGEAAERSAREIVALSRRVVAARLQRQLAAAEAPGAAAAAVAELWWTRQFHAAYLGREQTRALERGYTAARERLSAEQSRRVERQVQAALKEWGAPSSEGNAVLAAAPAAARRSGLKPFRREEAPAKARPAVEAAPDSDRAPRSMEDFVAVFGTQRGIDANLNDDVVKALALEWQVDDLELVRRRIRNALEVHDALAALRASNREVLADFEAANPGKEAGSTLAELAKQTHQSWLESVRGTPSFVPYDQPLHDLVLREVRAGRVRPGGGPPLTVQEFEDPRKKYKLALKDFHLPLGYHHDPQQQKPGNFIYDFQQITGNVPNGIVINTVAGEWDALMRLRAESDPARWAAERPAMLYRLQADSVASILAALHDPPLLRRLAARSKDARVAALVELLRRINVGWRLNNPWGGFTDRLIHLPFDLEENGGIGLDDIHKDMAVLKAVLGVLSGRMASGGLSLAPAIAEGLAAAFASGLEPLADRLMDRATLREAVVRNRLPESFVPEGRR